MKRKRSEAAKTVRGHRYDFKGGARDPLFGAHMLLWECKFCGHRTYRAKLNDPPTEGEGGSPCPYRAMGGR